jgi:hypothetical protein|tara:strand:- start:10611 stop:11564 length:954 start_codon:yes stop_codon:yes gene_type:complete
MAFVTVAIIGASIAGAGGLAKLGVSLAGRRGRINEQAAAKNEMSKMKKEYENLDTSNLAAGVRNPFANLENTFEDMTVNQQQAQFQSQQFQQSQANIMDSLGGAAGGSGIAGLAQTLANQGILSAQKSSASIGMQEAQNQKMANQQAAKNQAMEGQGEMYAEKMRQAGAQEARGLEYQKTSTLFGMSQQRTAAANNARAQAKSDQMSAIGDIASAGASIATAGMKIPKLPGGDVAAKVANTGTDILNQGIPGPKISNLGQTTFNQYDGKLDTSGLGNYNLGGGGTGAFGGGVGAFSGNYSLVDSPFSKKDLKINKNK